jgi:hypothetical protein
MTFTVTLTQLFAGLRRRLRPEGGFAMIVALGVLAIASLLVAAVYVAVNGDIHQSQHDLNSKRAYYAARAAENIFLYQLNQNPNYWSTCPTSATPTTLPGSTTGEQYSYAPVYNTGYSATNCAASPITALIDPSSGTLRIKFTGYSGGSTTTPAVSRTVVSSFRKPSPLDFLWYTDHEMEDPELNSSCTNEKYYYQYTRSNPAPSSCEINWVSGDTMSGPSYTNDQYLIFNNASPTFGRDGSSDQTESSAPTTSVCVSSDCQSATFKGQGATSSANSVPLPASVSNTQLLTDATANGLTFKGTTTIALSGSTAKITNCPSSNSSTACTSGWIGTDQSFLTKNIIYVQSGSSCPATYSLNTSYSTNNTGHYYGPCGDVYVSGSYNQPLTIVSDHDIIVVANSGSTSGITTTEDASGNPTGTATLGLVAADFVRVMHTAGVTPTAVTIDAAILTLTHSFMVDNYGNGSAPTAPKLTIHGAIAQRYRGIVGTTSGSGYIKDYHYDDRLHVLLPPYLFDLSTAGWQIVRETLCTTAVSTNSQSCAYQGS